MLAKPGGSSFKNWLAASRASVKSMPRNATLAPCSTTASAKNGNSARHGPHHDAHWLTTTGWPLSPARRRFRALVPSPAIVFASAALGCRGAAAPRTAPPAGREREDGEQRHGRGANARHSSEDARSARAGRWLGVVP